MMVGELFAGYGGLGMGLARVFPDARVAWVSEIDTGACKVLAHRFHGVPNIGDITTVDWSTVDRVDVLTGGFPCQDLSVAGLRRGLHDGTRSGLWSEMARAIDALRPGLVVIENVRGIYSAAANSDVEPCPWCVGDDPAEPSLRALGAVLGDLADIGYDAVWTGLRAADIGAPHERFRVFVVAWPSDYIPDAQFLGRGGRPGIGVLGGPVKLLPTPAVNDMGAGKTVDEWDGWTASMKAKHGNGNGHGPSLSVESLRLLPTPDTTHGRETTRTGPLLGGLPSLLPSPRASDGEKVGPSQLGSSGDLALPSAVQNGRWGAYAAAVARWEALTRPAQQPTEPTGRDGAHRLSAYFTEWMMGLPEGWVCDTPGVTRAEALRMCGNGVVPQQAAAAIAHLLDVRSSLPAPSNESVP